MKKILFITMLFSIFVKGQTDFYSSEEFYGGGIGYSPMYIVLDSIPGSSLLNSLGLNSDDFASPFVVHGGEGFTQISGRWRIGGYAGVGVSRISTVPDISLFINRDGVDGYQAPPGVVPDWSVQDTTILYNGEFAPSIRASVSFAMGAASIEYVIPLFRDLEITTGALLGFGRLSIGVDQHSGTPRWKSSFSNMYGETIGDTLYYEVASVNDISTAQSSGLTAGNITGRLVDISGTFFNFQPYMAMKWQIMDRVGLRVSVGYNRGSIPAGGWRLNDQTPINDSPASAFKGVAIRTMFYFGL